MNDFPFWWDIACSINPKLLLSVNYIWDIKELFPARGL
jgi:uncharacterized membrane protein YhdT